MDSDYTIISQDNNETTSGGNEIILYQPDSTTKLKVRIEDDTVWLTQAQIVELFNSSKANISEHLKNIFESEELNKNATVRNYRTVRIEGSRRVNRNLEYFNLDVIISVGYRVNTKKGIQFRQWANKVLKEYLLRGYSVNQRLLYMESCIDNKLLEHERRLDELSDKVDFFVKASLPPVEGIFYDGQIFDAYRFICNIVKSAKYRILLIDNYVDESVLTLFDKRDAGIEAKIFTQNISRQLQLDIERHNTQYSPIEVKKISGIHDRFLIVDDTLYHIGASIKDLGKKLFAFSKMEASPSEILSRI